MGEEDPTRQYNWSRRSLLRSAGAAVVGLTGVTHFGSQPSRASGHPSTTDLVIESFDGTPIAATLYEPASPGPHAAVLMTHGWGSDRSSVAPLARFYASQDFVVLAYDSRGFGESGGTVTSTGPNEVGDARALISWLADRDEVQNDDADDPVIGMDGFSYGGGIQLRTAAVDDRLDAIVPRITWHDLVSTFEPNEVFKVAWWRTLQFVAQDDNLDPELEAIGETVSAPEGLPPEAEEFYRSRSPVSYLDGVRTPTLLIHSWYDRLFPPSQALANFRGLRANGVEASLIVQNGSGHHLGNPPDATRFESRFVAGAALRWLDAHLRGDGNHGLAPLHLYDASTDSFIAAGSFPPAGASTATFAPDARGSVRVRNLPANRPGEELVEVDFPIESRTELLGTPTLEVSVTPTGRGTTRLATALQHVTGDGASTIKDQVTPVRVGGHTRLELELAPIHRVLEPGDVLRLAIATRDEHVDDVEIPQLFSDTGLFVDTDAQTGATLLNTPAQPERLTIPTR